MEKYNDSHEEETNKKIKIVISARIKDQNQINKSIDIQDRLSRKSGSFSGENEIRKWREMR